MRAIGHRTWAIAGGFVPLVSTGAEPALTSRDQLAVLNTGERDADIRMTVYYPDREPVGPYAFRVRARRMRTLRFNDLIHPEALPLDVAYAALIECDRPVVVQFTRLDTSHASRAWLSSLAFPVE